MCNEILKNLGNPETYKCSGIYMFKNKINDKCYVGQSINIYHRLINHLNWFNKEKGDTAIHRAFIKYGVDNFEIQILEKLEYYEGIKVKLDELEKRYIQEYDSYNNGYNSTLGGDAGVLGLKMTEEQKNKIRINSIIENRKRYPHIYVEDVVNNVLYRFINMTRAAEKLGIPRSNIGRAANWEYRVLQQRYIVARNLDELKERREYIRSHPEALSAGRFKKGDVRCVGKQPFRHRKSHKCPEYQKEMIRERTSIYNYELCYRTGEYIGLYSRRDLLLEAHPDINQNIFKNCGRVELGEYLNYKQYKIRRFLKENLNNNINESPSKE